MTKAYWITHLDVDDPIVYEEYKVANAVVFSKFNGRFIIRGGQKQLRKAPQKAAPQ